MEDRIKKALTDIVGPTGFSDQLMDLVTYSYDASDHSHRPEAAVWPTRSEQVSGILKLANAHRFPVVPRGAGTGLTGAVIPVSGGLVLDLCRMTQIIADVKVMIIVNTPCQEKIMSLIPRMFPDGPGEVPADEGIKESHCQDHCQEGLPTQTQAVDPFPVFVKETVSHK